MDRNLIGICLAVAIASTANAASNFENGRYKTTVIEDRGGKPIQKYIPPVQTPEEWAQEVYHERGNKRLVEGMYPVRTPSLTVGRVTEAEGKGIPKLALGTRSMFIIGDDPVSRRWLADNREYLRSHNAVGLVVNVESVERMNALSQIAGEGLRLQPTPGADIAKTMGIKHYPFFIGKDGIMR